MKGTKIEKIYFFDGSKGCDTCAANTGFSINKIPAWPHPNCDCKIIEYVVLKDGVSADKIPPAAEAFLRLNEKGEVESDELESYLAGDDADDTIWAGIQRDDSFYRDPCRQYPGPCNQIVTSVTHSQQFSYDNCLNPFGVIRSHTLDPDADLLPNEVKDCHTPLTKNTHIDIPIPAHHVVSYTIDTEHVFIIYFREIEEICENNPTPTVTTHHAFYNANISVNWDGSLIVERDCTPQPGGGVIA